MLYEAGETIEAGMAVAIREDDGKAWSARSSASGNRAMVGIAIERLREGMRICVKNGKAWEDQG